ncbi:MAG: hypothetical protein ACP5SH_02960 [Syntrophobacteraceae bacterium]
MEWREVVEHPSLQDLPFKIETNAEGYIMMVAAKNIHREYQARIHVWFKVMKYRRSLFFEAGAKEVWFCDIEGNMRFFNPRGELERSGMFAEFPGRIEIEEQRSKQ